MKSAGTGPFPLTAVTGSLDTGTGPTSGGLNIIDGGVSPNGGNPNPPVPGTVAVTFDPNTNQVTAITFNQNGADHELLGLDGTTINNPQSVSKITKEIISTAVQGLTAGTPAVLNEALSFSAFGVWANQFPNSDPNHPGVLAVGVYAAGSPTPASAVPTSGSATYTGDAAGFASIPTPAGDAHTNGTMNMAFDANASIGINFGTGAVNSSITNIHAVSMDEIGTTATLPNLTGTGNMIAGTPNYSTNLSGTAFAGTQAMTGALNGTLMGPTAHETVGTFSATNGVAGVGGINLMGAFGAHM